MARGFLARATRSRQVASRKWIWTSIRPVLIDRSARSIEQPRTQNPAAVSRGGFFFDHRVEKFVLGRPGSDLLFQALRLSTIGAEEFNGRVRDGNGFRPLARTTRSAKDGKCKLAFCVQPFPRLIP